MSRAIAALRLTPVMFELGARPHPPRDLYRAYLEQSEIFIGTYWERYGQVVPGTEVSGLEDEFELSRRLPRLLYIKEPAPQRRARPRGLVPLTFGSVVRYAGLYGLTKPDSVELTGLVKVRSADSGDKVRDKGGPRIRTKGSVHRPGGACSFEWNSIAPAALLSSRRCRSEARASPRACRSRNPVVRMEGDSRAGCHEAARAPDRETIARGSEPAGRLFREPSTRLCDAPMPRAGACGLATPQGVSHRPACCVRSRRKSRLRADDNQGPFRES